ncbi:phosphonate metabolism transcriptional regulator PhnF [Roseomonas sp. BN140053]|uniref:phosphonate metabolism transcriptional regulator PhnF n=1 Tax=Roseomonas sp. BN140053 TaxID=3391898 RepID=UPI0039E9FB70
MKQNTRSSWRKVETVLDADIRDGRLEAGQRLPPEPKLMERFGVGRHSVRRAVAELEARGLLRVQQGSGTFVRDAGMLDYRLSERTRFSQNLLDQGREPSGITLEEEEIVAPPEVAEALRLAPGELVYRSLRLGLADEVPVNISNAYYPVRRFPGILEARRGRRSLGAILGAYGVGDYVRLRSAITTRLPTAEEARHLDQPRTQPVLVVRKVDADLDGIPVTCSESVWAGERVQLSVDNAPPRPRRDAAPRAEGAEPHPAAAQDAAGARPGTVAADAAPQAGTAGNAAGRRRGTAGEEAGRRPGAPQDNRR